MSLRQGTPDPIAVERERQLREGVGCLTCGTRFHAPSTDLEGRCPVCKARAERDRLRGVLEAIERIVWDESLTDEQVIGGVQQAVEETLR